MMMMMMICDVLDPRSVHMGLVLDPVAMVQVYLWVLQFFPIHISTLRLLLISQSSTGNAALSSQFIASLKEILLFPLRGRFHISVSTGSLMYLNFVQTFFNLETRKQYYFEDGGSRLVLYVDTYLPISTTSHPRNLIILKLPPWEASVPDTVVNQMTTIAQILKF